MTGVFIVLISVAVICWLIVKKILSSMVFVRGGHRDDRHRGGDLRRSGGNR